MDHEEFTLRETEVWRVFGASSTSWIRRTNPALWLAALSQWRCFCLPFLNFLLRNFKSAFLSVSTARDRSYRRSEMLIIVVLHSLWVIYQLNRLFRFSLRKPKRMWMRLFSGIVWIYSNNKSNHTIPVFCRANKKFLGNTW